MLSCWVAFYLLFLWFILIVHISLIIYLSFWAYCEFLVSRDFCLSWFSLTSSWFVNVTASDSIFFLIKTKYYFIVCVYHIFIIHCYNLSLKCFPKSHIFWGGTFERWLELGSTKLISGLSHLWIHSWMYHEGEGPACRRWLTGGQLEEFILLHSFQMLCVLSFLSMWPY